MKPLHVAFVWHMHQPYYKDDLTSTYLLPWVRLRSAKDYYKMPALLDGYPKLRATFNLVPSLLAQIEDYGKEESVDLFLNLSRRAAADLSAEEHDFLLRWMRDSPRALRVQQSPRYLELASRPADAQFTTQDIRDLQVWFNLAWCDPVWMETDPRLAELKRKDRDFAEADKQPLFTAQLDMMKQVIPKYRELADRGQAELTFSPYYHPILPLLAHVDSARIANPQIQLPEHHFSHREDAERQIELGLGLFERLLGRRPTGMWPSEMAVGESIVDLVASAGVSWMISDEEVLARSMESRYSRDEHLFSPKLIEREGQSLTMVFRDSQISNAIGFDYQRMSSTDAARNLVGRLKRIGEQQGDRNLLVVVALDGENAWEFYPRDGHDFLNALYSELESTEDVVTTTVADFIAGAPRATAAAPRTHRQLDRREPRHLDRRPRAQRRVGSARRNPRLARGAIPAASEGFGPVDARLARDPDHRGQRLVLVVQPQARLGHGPDLGQPVPPSLAECLQAPGLASPGPSVPADHQARAGAGAGYSRGDDQPRVTRRRRVGQGGLLPGRLRLWGIASTGGNRGAGLLRQRRRGAVLPDRHAAHGR